MAVVETERNGQVLVVRMNRPERLNALNAEMWQMLAETWTEFRHDEELEVAILTGSRSMATRSRVGLVAVSHRPL